MEDNELQQLINGCKKNDRQSQKLLYHKLYGYAMKICLRYANNRHEASEVLNDGFFKAFTQIEKYDSKRPFTSWLSKIMYHASIDYYRSNLKWTKLEQLDQSHDTSHQVTVEQQLHYEELLEIIQQLPPTYRLIFNLYAIDGYSHEEIATIVGISASTSRANLFKARRKLQQMLSKPYSMMLMLLIWDQQDRSAKQTTINELFHSNSGHS
ncbi:MAG TPA: sigma-70 family RNA polymerase sigma factor [Sunxiuqinia sp.]|nr:sigma-70 family RNA polymerase sigma factor [Sunxiuqinia sp.]